MLFGSAYFALSAFGTSPGGRGKGYNDIHRTNARNVGTGVPDGPLGSNGCLNRTIPSTIRMRNEYIRTMHELQRRQFAVYKRNDTERNQDA